MSKLKRHREKKSLHPDSVDGPIGNRADGHRHRAAGRMKNIFINQFKYTQQ